ncbi:hypothetical protein [Neobacillus niacini]|uniref:hypothetical protein n=1 Tax=Neobacillus niacini TaxID=86668 RepID=UPI00285EC848|nr:hypothetical protein [Neobacillus niacini]MDR6999841.1 hypothetical protein [Neobacillus niacini]
MATLRSGPIPVPSTTCSGDPVNTVMVTLTNQTTQTLQAVLKINEVTLNPQPLPPETSPIRVLMAPQRVTLRPNEARSFAVPVAPAQPPESLAVNAATAGSSGIIVTVRGDVGANGRRILASVSGGFAAPGEALTSSEPSMAVTHDQFVVVRRG